MAAKKSMGDDADAEFTIGKIVGFPNYIRWFMPDSIALVESGQRSYVTLACSIAIFLSSGQSKFSVFKDGNSGTHRRQKASLSSYN